MTTSLRISSDGRHTGALLQSYLTNRGVYSPDGEALVYYGHYHEGHGRPNLNGNGKPRSGKIDNMRLMHEGGCRTVPWLTARQANAFVDVSFPLLARKAHGMGGTDIVPVFQREEIPWRIAAGWEWFSSYVPLEAEYRVWAWRGEALDTFQKVMRRPATYTRIGRNFDNGFDFEYTADVPAVTEQAIMALMALGLDFGAVDLLLGKDGRVYVLEVNTAPGALKSHAEATVAKLADRITSWVKEGYPNGL